MYSFSLTWDPIGVKISKPYSSYKSQPKVFERVLNFAPNGPHKTTFRIFEILNFRFLTFFFRKFQIHHCSYIAYWEIKKPQLSGKRAIVEQNGVKFGTRELYFNIYPWPCSVRGHSVHFRFFRKCNFQKIKK